VVLSDEENGGDFGAKFLVEEHPQLFDGVHHALGEAGGISQVIAGKRFYPIQLGEKQICWLKATVRGPGGHGAMIHRGGTMARLARMLRDLDRKRMPIHVTPIVQEMIETIAAHMPRPKRDLVLALLKPAVADRVLPRLGPKMRPIETLLRNTVNATIVRGGEKVNVIPAQIDLELDGRVLPGFTPDDLIGELHDLVGDDIARPRRHPDAVAAGRRHGRPLLRAARDPDLRVHPDAPAGRLPHPADRPRGRRAHPGRRAGFRDRGRVARPAAVLTASLASHR